MRGRVASAPKQKDKVLWNSSSMPVRRCPEPPTAKDGFSVGTVNLVNDRHPTISRGFCQRRHRQSESATPALRPVFRSRLICVASPEAWPCRGLSRIDSPLQPIPLAPVLSAHCQWKLRKHRAILRSRAAGMRPHPAVRHSPCGYGLLLQVALSRPESAHHHRVPGQR
jgi:hypothetical protein